jgi:hypothetical protein
MGHTNENSSVEHWNPRDRAFDYGMVFAAGLAVAASIGSLVGVLTGAAVPSAIGSAIVFLGVLCLLSAGLTGGQYAAGGVGRGAARYTFVNQSFSPLLRRDPLEGAGSDALVEELSHGYRPKKDPTAFWLAIGGILYVATGFIILMASS